MPAALVRNGRQEGLEGDTLNELLTRHEGAPASPGSECRRYHFSQTSIPGIAPGLPRRFDHLPQFAAGRPGRPRGFVCAG
jgi:hypothetical protein